MSRVFITGTDTGIGKTYVTVRLTQQLIAMGYRVAALKPVASGASVIDGCLRNADALQLQSVSNIELSYQEVNPYCFAAPISPHLAAAQHNSVIDFDIIKAQLNQTELRADLVVVEGVGGWFAPLREDATVADLVEQLRTPVILVVGLRLGCLNHAELTARAIDNSACKFVGWIANAIDPHYNVIDESIDYLKVRLNAPYLGFIAPHGTEIKITSSFNSIIPKLNSKT